MAIYTRLRRQCGSTRKMSSNRLYKKVPVLERTGKAASEQLVQAIVCKSKLVLSRSDFPFVVVTDLNNH